MKRVYNQKDYLNELKKSLKKSINDGKPVTIVFDESPKPLTTGKSRLALRMAYEHEKIMKAQGKQSDNFEEG